MELTMEVYHHVFSIRMPKPVTSRAMIQLHSILLPLLTPRRVLVHCIRAWQDPLSLVHVKV